LTDGLATVAAHAGVAFSAQSIGGMFGIYFARSVPDSFAAVMNCDKERFNRFFHAMLDAGVYLAPSAFEAGFVSSAHADEHIDETVRVAAAALCGLAQV
jgi:glutamate-1-semialdehyde 2,1-aminomutase